MALRRLDPPASVGSGFSGVLGGGHNGQGGS